jgi:hypothetical protein
MTAVDRQPEGPGGLLLPTSSADRPVTGSSGMSSPSLFAEHRQQPQSVSFSAVSSSATAEDRATRREVRTLPSRSASKPLELSPYNNVELRRGAAWVHSFEEEGIEDLDPCKRFLLPTYPGNIQHAHHNTCPAPPSARPGKLHDAARDRATIAIASPAREHASRWQAFARGSAYPPASSGESQIVDDAWLDEHGGDLESPWGAGMAGRGGEKGDELLFIRNKKKRRVWYKRAQVRLYRPT